MKTKRHENKNKVQKTIQMFLFWIGFSSLYGAYNGYCKKINIIDFNASGQRLLFECELTRLQ